MQASDSGRCKSHADTLHCALHDSWIIAKLVCMGHAQRIWNKFKALSQASTSPALWNTGEHRSHHKSSFASTPARNNPIPLKSSSHNDNPFPNVTAGTCKLLLEMMDFVKAFGSGGHNNRSLSLNRCSGSLACLCRGICSRKPTEHCSNRPPMPYELWQQTNL